MLLALCTLAPSLVVRCLTRGCRFNSAPVPPRTLTADPVPKVAADELLIVRDNGERSLMSSKLDLGFPTGEGEYSECERERLPSDIMDPRRDRSTVLSR